MSAGRMPSLGGLYPVEDDFGFNEAIASCYLDVAASLGVSTDYQIPFSFSSPAELDLVFVGYGLTPTSGVVSVSGGPNGIFAYYAGSSGSGQSATIFLVGTAIRITVLGAQVNGSLRVIRRNRRVKNSFALPGTSGAEAQLPFTVGNPHKTILVPDKLAGAASGISACPFIDEYIPLSAPNSWHYSSYNSGAERVKLTSPNTYVTPTSSGYATIIEFE